MIKALVLGFAFVVYVIILSVWVVLKSVFNTLSVLFPCVGTFFF